MFRGVDFRQRRSHWLWIRSLRSRETFAQLAGLACGLSVWTIQRFRRSYIRGVKPKFIVEWIIIIIISRSWFLCGLWRSLWYFRVHGCFLWTPVLQKLRWWSRNSVHQWWIPSSPSLLQNWNTYLQYRNTASWHYREPHSISGKTRGVQYSSW